MKLARLLEKRRIAANQPALAAAVVVGGKIKAAAAVGTRKYGTRNWVTVDDNFIIGSCGKALTSTVAALMVDEGMLRWDTTIGNVFPSLESSDAFRNISLMQLLSHSAGLPKSFMADLKRSVSYTPTAGRLVYLSQIAQTELHHPPGTVKFYSNTGYILAGLMMEVVSGKEFNELMSMKLFKPLNLATAGYGAPA